MTYTAEDWNRRCIAYEAEGKYPNLSVTCPNCLRPIQPEGGKVLYGCKCGNTTTHAEIDAAHGLTGYVGPPLGNAPIEDWADVA